MQPKGAIVFESTEPKINFGGHLFLHSKILRCWRHAFFPYLGVSCCVFRRGWIFDSSLLFQESSQQTLSLDRESALERCNWVKKRCPNVLAWLFTYIKTEKFSCFGAVWCSTLLKNRSRIASPRFGISRECLPRWRCFRLVSALECAIRSEGQTPKRVPGEN